MFSTLSNLLPSALSEKLEKLDLRNQNQNTNGNDNAAEDEETREETAQKEASTRKEKKKRSTTNEVFIIVRPPPAKTNHPLNLQVQLVPAYNARERSNTAQSTDTAPPSPDDTHLRRSASTSSRTSSSFYAASSTGSVTSFASSTSTSSGRRMIIPLYNLHAHNVMTNTILDAGTDARVAKFHRKGLEIIGLGILEPTELWVPKGEADAYHALHRKASKNSFVQPVPQPAAAGTAPGSSSPRVTTPEPAPSQSPGSSRLSLSSEQSHTPMHPTAHTDTSASLAAPPTPSGAKKLFGKIFKRKDTPARAPAPAPSTTHPLTTVPSINFTSEPSPTTPSTARPSTSMQQPASPLPPGTPTTPMLPLTPTLSLMPGDAAAARQELPSVLGLTPTLAPGSPHGAHARVVHVVWVVRKWLKPENEGLIAGVLGRMAREASAHGLGSKGEGLGGAWEVRFEWVRGRKKEKSRGVGKRASASTVGEGKGGGAGGSRTPSRRSSRVLGEEDGVPVLVDSPRASMDAGRRRSIDRKSLEGDDADDDDTRTHETLEDDGNESDPEDSETPWTCTLVLQHLPSLPPTPNTPVTPTAATPTSRRHSRNLSAASGGSHLSPAPTPTTSHLIPPSPTPSTFSTNGAPLTPPTKLKVATLSPAPHHPKVVCQLKIPYPLPDVAVPTGTIHKRVLQADGTTRATVPGGGGGGGGAGGLVLSAEEIKDVVCSTACWLVVREGIGGVGKEKRKGDGWRIRG